MTVLSGHAQRRHAVIPRHVDVRAQLDQRPHYRLVTVLSGDVQRRHAVIPRLVDVRAELDKRPHHRLVAQFSGDEQRILGKWAAVRARPLQHLEVPSLRRIRARVSVPQAVVLARPL